MTSNGALPDQLELEADVDPPLSPEERRELEALGTLLSSRGAFDLAPAARARGRAELQTRLRKRRSTRRTLWLALPVAAGVFFAWLDPLSLRTVPAPAAPSELTLAQSALLTAELTGAPIARDDLERATRAYRQHLLVSLERGR